ncbi:MAG: endopeptidase La [Candidatus Margulisbacteria bacterium]|nr:endopeptidase La [Candidatus Margulisiibacteriota bacterium]
MVKNSAKKWNDELPLVPLRNIVVFPHMIVPLFVGREKSIHALEQVMGGDKLLVLATQKREELEDPEPEDIHSKGILVEIVQHLKLPDGTTKVLVEGISRVKIKKFLKQENFYKVQIEKLEEKFELSVELEALVRLVIESFEAYVKLNKKIPAETLMSIINVDDPGRLADLIASYLVLKVEEKQEMLEMVDVRKRLEKLNDFLSRENELLEVEKKLHGKVKDQIEKVQKEYYLKEKLKAIQEELGSEEGELSEIDEYKKKIREAKMPIDIEKKALKEIGRLAHMQTLSAEAGVIRTYLDWLIELPWAQKSKAVLDIKEVKKVLEADHYGLEKVKERILEYFAVFKITKKAQGTILCLAGPPGVGKTSIAQSIARAMKREFARISLGGMRDEAELRGHRRTYVGSLPGRIIQSIHRVKSSNPVILLDEIDKISTDYRGDPAAVLMEILDPEQNVNFSDHYLEVAYDLSDIIFIATANTLHNIPQALRDRMEVITISGYTEDEKIEIAFRYLLPKQLKKNGLTEKDVTFTKEGLRMIINEYTKEAGLRDLERNLSAICRKITREKLEGKAKLYKISRHNMHFFLGVPKFKQEKAHKKDRVGVALGLAWTEAGGDILPIEVTILPGHRALMLTGKMGEVMQESAKAALSYVRSIAPKLGVEYNFYRKTDIHIHVPEGAIPKDGPSAGIALATALASAVSGIPIKGKVAMTGEITLRGRVLPIGGLKSKLLAAGRAEIETVLIPQDNVKDLKEISNKIKRNLKIIAVSHMDQVLAYALTKPLENKEKDVIEKESNKTRKRTNLDNQLRAGISPYTGDE